MHKPGAVLFDLSLLYRIILRHNQARVTDIEEGCDLGTLVFFNVTFWYQLILELLKQLVSCLLIETEYHGYYEAI